MNDKNDHPEDPLSRLLSQFGFSMSGDLNSLFSQLQNAMSSHGGVWDFTKREAIKIAEAADNLDASLEPLAVADADRLTNSWLDAEISFDSLATTPDVWTPRRWVEETMLTWRQIGEPVSSRIAESFAQGYSSSVSGMIPDMPEGIDLSAAFGPMLRQATESMYADRLAKAIGRVSHHVLSGADMSLQPLEKPQVILIAENVAAFRDGLGIAPDDVLLYLTVRESARQRLFSHVGWLGTSILALVENYARHITIDVSSLDEGLAIDDISQLTPDRIAKMNDDINARLFSPQLTTEQEEILERLETLLALVDGWIEHVAARTTQRWMPHAAPMLSEAMNRRRATDDPTSALLENLVGLSLRPRRVRDAAALWDRVADARGIEERDAMWSHPDLIPTSEDLDDPSRITSRDAPERDDMDHALDELLSRAEEERDDE